MSAMALFDTIPAVGYHYYTWLEYSNQEAAGTTTWYGDNGAAVIQTGITAMWKS